MRARSTSRIRALALALVAALVTTGPAPVAAQAATAAAVQPKAPEILMLATGPAVIHAGDIVNWTVLTTPDVAAVAAHVTLYTIVLHRLEAGRFAITFRVPTSVPPIFHGRYSVKVVASTSGGDSASRTFPLEFR